MKQTLNLEWTNTSVAKIEIDKVNEEKIQDTYKFFKRTHKNEFGFKSFLDYLKRTCEIAGEPIIPVKFVSMTSLKKGIQV